MNQRGHKKSERRPEAEGPEEELVSFIEPALLLQPSQEDRRGKIGCNKMGTDFGLEYFRARMKFFIGSLMKNKCSTRAVARCLSELISSYSRCDTSAIDFEHRKTCTQEH